MESKNRFSTKTDRTSSDFEQYFDFLRENWRNIISRHQAHSVSGQEAQLLVWEEFVKLKGGNEGVMVVRTNFDEIQSSKHSKKKIVASFDLKNPYLEETSAGGKTNTPVKNDSSCEISRPELEHMPFKPKFTVPLKQKAATDLDKVVPPNADRMCTEQKPFKVVNEEQDRTGEEVLR